MPKLSRSVTDGWLPPAGRRGNAREAVEAIILPDTITCALCQRDLPLRSFSTTALRRLRQAIQYNGMRVLNNQQVARCDGCGTQSRPELHCMTCNSTRPIDEFAHTQRQYDQPVCLPCQDGLQQDERDKLLAGQLSRDMAKYLPEQMTEDNTGSALASTDTSKLTEHFSKESTPVDEHASMQAILHARTRLELRTGGSASSLAAHNLRPVQREEGEMHFDAVFEDDEGAGCSGSYGQW